MSPAASTTPIHSNGGQHSVQKAPREPHFSSAQVIQMEHEYGAHNYHPLPVVFDRAKGAKVWDPEGNEYIDMLSAYSAVNQVSPLTIQVSAAPLLGVI
ncbi:ornithine aminotransferase [Stygiomarasmius scandens]|uniref:Ornithine aminotransferase n=1 Tax=Marasmiellus scandens TaxID=2682957 RepID=A0ABR1J664_9AGAR